MGDYAVGALITGGIALALFILNRLFGADSASSVAHQWKEWAQEQGQRIDDLEARVKSLEEELIEERRKNRKYAQVVAALVRWALALRDEVISLGGNVPPAPPEVEEALTTLEL